MKVMLLNKETESIYLPAYNESNEDVIENQMDLFHYRNGIKHTCACISVFMYI